MSANDIQIGGDHFKRFGDIQPWDIVVAWDLGYFEGNIVKYVSRWSRKNGVEDLKKARHYLDKLIEVVEATKAKQKPNDTPIGVGLGNQSYIPAPPIDDDFPF